MLSFHGIFKKNFFFRITVKLTRLKTSKSQILYEPVVSLRIMIESWAQGVEYRKCTEFQKTAKNSP